MAHKPIAPFARKAAAILALSAPFFFTQQASAKTVTVTNTSGGTVTLTDMISFTNNTNTGASTVHMKKNDATDDINLAAGGKKNFDVGAHKSWTVSWNNKDGKEVETDTTNLGVAITAAQLAMFDSNFNGVYDIEYDFAIAGVLPTIGQLLLLDNNGHPIGSGLEWITFFDVTNSPTGFIERDALGNAISPLLPEGTEVTPSFLWSFSVVPEPGSLAIVGLGLGLLGLSRRLTKQSANDSGAFKPV